MANWFDSVPAPVDSDGEIVPLLTKKLYAGNGEALDVELIGFDGRWVVTFDRKDFFNLDWFYLYKPDSWESLEEDAKKAPRDYVEGRGIEVGSDGRVTAMARDIVSRAKDLAGVSNEG